MKKIISVSILMVGFCYMSFSQKPDIEKLKTIHTQYPAKPLPDSVKTYSVQVVNSSKTPLTINDAMIQNYLKFEGFQYNAQKPDVIITVFITDVVVETGTSSKATLGGSQFFYTATARMIGKVCFNTPDNRFELYTVTELDKPEDLAATVESSGGYATEDAAKQALANDKVIKEKAVSAFGDVVFKNIGVYLNKQHGYPVKTDYLPVWGIKSKGTEYQDFDKAVASYQTAVSMLNQPAKVSEMETKFKESIQVWEKAVAEYNPSDKDARISSKNILEIYCNLALANAWINNFPEAKKYFTMAEKEKGLVLWKPVIQQLITDRQQGLERNAMRKSNAMVIEKKPSPLYRSPEFVASNSKYRIKYIESYDEHNPKLLSSRKVFEYDRNGLLTVVYQQAYDVSSKKFFGSGGIQKMIYNHHESTITLPNASDRKPPEVFTIKQGKVIKHKGVQESLNDFHNLFYEYAYNSDGTLKNITQVGKYPERGRVNYNFIYDKGKIKTIEQKGWNIQIKDTLYNNLRFSFKPAAGGLTLESAVSKDQKNNFDHKAATYNYAIDAKGLINSISSPGQRFFYKYDENGNVTEVIINSDTTPVHYTYVWEEGPSNASFYLFSPANYTTYPGLYPPLYYGL